MTLLLTPNIGKLLSETKCNNMQPATRTVNSHRNLVMQYLMCCKNACALLVLWLGLKCLLLSITFRLIGLNKKEGMGGKAVCHFLFLTRHWSDGSFCPDSDGKVLPLLLPNVKLKSGARGTTWRAFAFVHEKQGWPLRATEDNGN